MRIDWVKDELILALEIYFKHGLLDKSSVEIRDLSDVLKSLPIHFAEQRDDNFRSPASVALKLANLANHDPTYTGKRTNGSALDGIVFSEWVGKEAELSQTAFLIRKIAGDSSGPTSLEKPEFEAKEGRVLSILHFRRERDPRLRRLKIQQVLKVGGTIKCEVCDFSFEKFYGTRGAGYIECHHTVPLHVSGPVTTKLSDLALLCSNCHSMVHSSVPWLSIEELRDRIRNQKEDPDNLQH
jgi:5-methylcytosine-specific restriction protein A